MRRERRTMLSLIAAGRITAADALRLEAIWAAQREQILEICGVIALCILIVVAQSTPTTALAHLLGNSAVNLIHHVAGGAR